MKNRLMWALVIGSLCVIAAITTVISALFHGQFDRGRYEIAQVQSRFAEKVALVARRSDSQAMNNDVYFVLLADHVLSPQELKEAYYQRRSIFATNRDCLNLRWSNPTSLEIICDGNEISSDQIDFQ